MIVEAPPAREGRESGKQSVGAADDGVARQIEIQCRRRGGRGSEVGDRGGDGDRTAGIAGRRPRDRRDGQVDRDAADRNGVARLRVIGLVAFVDQVGRVDDGADEVGARGDGGRDRHIHADQPLRARSQQRSCDAADQGVGGGNDRIGRQVEVHGRRRRGRAAQVGHRGAKSDHVAAVGAGRAADGGDREIVRADALRPAAEAKSMKVKARVGFQLAVKIPSPAISSGVTPSSRRGRSLPPTRCPSPARWGRRS